MSDPSAKAVVLSDGRYVMAYPQKRSAMAVLIDADFVLTIRDGRRLGMRDLLLSREAAQAAIDVLQAALEEWPERAA